VSVFAVIAALALEQWRPLGERKTYFAALAAWAGWLERSFNAGESRHGLIAWLAALVLPLAATLALYACSRG
jgi:adenosylcobinamide-phosphate synthase